MTSAPAPTSVATILSWPASAAAISGISQIPALLTSAPAPMSVATTLSWLALAAAIRGVVPVSS